MMRVWTAGCRSWCKISTCWSSTEWDGVQNGCNSLKPYSRAERDHRALHLLQINRKVSKAFLRGTTIRCMTHYARPFKHTRTLRHREGSIAISSFTDHHKIQMIQVNELCLSISTYRSTYRKRVSVPPITQHAPNGASLFRFLWFHLVIIKTFQQDWCHLSLLFPHGHDNQISTLGE